MSSSCTAQDYRRHFLSSANGRDVRRLAQMGPAKHTAVFRCLPSSPHNSSNVKPRPSPFVPQRSPVWFQPSGQSLQDRMLFEVCRYVHPDSWKISQGCWAMTLSSLSRVVPNPKGQKYSLTSEFLCSVFSPPRRWATSGVEWMKSDFTPIFPNSWHDCFTSDPRKHQTTQSHHWHSWRTRCDAAGETAFQCAQ